MGAGAAAAAADAVTNLIGIGVNSYNEGKNRRSQQEISRLNRESAERINQQQLDFAEKWNNIQRGDAHNAYSIATADRLKAGLSPLDARPANAVNADVPQLNVPEAQSYATRPIDFSGIGSAFSNAVQLGNQSAVADSTVALNNAASFEKVQEGISKHINNLHDIQTLQTRIEKTKEDLQSLKYDNEKKNVDNTYQIREKEKNLSLMDEQMSLLESQAYETSASTSRQNLLAAKNLSLAPSEFRRLASETSLNNARAMTEETKQFETEQKMLEDLRNQAWYRQKSMPSDKDMRSNLEKWLPIFGGNYAMPSDKEWSRAYRLFRKDGENQGLQGSNLTRYVYEQMVWYIQKLHTDAWDKRYD